MKAFNRTIAMGLVIMCTLSTASSAMASYTGQPTVVIDGTTISTTVAPYITDGTTMVPLRSISEYMGASVDWDPTTRSIHIEKGTRTVDLTVGQVAAKINGETVTTTMSPTIRNDYTMVPLRFIGEALNCQVGWDANIKTVTIITGDVPVEEIEKTATDAYGRAIRTTNLPSNSADFPYIAEEIPNWCYEIQPTIMKNNYWGPAWYSDTHLKGDTAADVAKANSSLFPQNCSGGVYETVQKFVELQTNIDYNTLDSTWVDGMLSCFSKSQVAFLEAESKKNNDPILTMKELLESYLSMYTSDHTITSSTFKVMPEAMWVDVYGFPHVPVYIQYTVNNSDTKQNLFNITFGDTRAGATPAYGFTIGKTYEAVVTYTLTKDSDGTWKIDYTSCDADGQIRPCTDFTDGVAPSMKDSNRQNDFPYGWLKEDMLFNRYAEAPLDIQGGTF